MIVRDENGSYLRLGSGPSPLIIMHGYGVVRSLLPYVARFGRRQRWWITLGLTSFHVHTWSLGFCFQFNRHDGLTFRRFAHGSNA